MILLVGTEDGGVDLCHNKCIFLSNDDGVLIKLTVRPSLSKYKNHNYQYYYFD